MLNGPGGTGKSTFISAVSFVLGDYAKVADFSTFLKKDRVSGGPSEDIATLAGARLVSSIEVKDGQRLAEALLKQLTGGDIIRARNLYNPPSSSDRNLPCGWSATDYPMLLMTTMRFGAGFSVCLLKT